MSKAVLSIVLGGGGFRVSNEIWFTVPSDICPATCRQSLTANIHPSTASMLYPVLCYGGIATLPCLAVGLICWTPVDHKRWHYKYFAMHPPIPPPPLTVFFFSFFIFISIYFFQQTFRLTQLPTGAFINVSARLDNDGEHRRAVL